MQKINPHVFDVAHLIQTKQIKMKIRSGVCLLTEHYHDNICSDEFPSPRKARSRAPGGETMEKSSKFENNYKTKVEPLALKQSLVYKVELPMVSTSGGSFQ